MRNYETAMATKLQHALRLTSEENAAAFERYANAFLVDDFPELQPLGGERDKGMDARILSDSTGHVTLVVQSCVSPASTARTKILATIKKLNEYPPPVFVYCTPAIIGTALDETKRELRALHKVTLEICDGAWFVQREGTSANRGGISDAFAREVLDPIIRDLQPDRLYSLVLTDQEERIAIQYLEAANLDRAKEGNWTKTIFDALITCVTRDSDPAGKVYSKEEIVAAICGMFPPAHEPRIREIVPPRIERLVRKRAIHFDKQADGYVLSFPHRKRMSEKIQKAQEREVAFLAALNSAVVATANEQEVDYAFSVEEVARQGHQCIVWFLSEQGKSVTNPAASLLGIFNAERLVQAYLDRNPLPSAPPKGISNEVLLDLLPHALYLTLTSNDEETIRYVRAKADLFIIRGFLDITPDVQAACRKLLGGDTLYLDTTILIRCIAEHFSPPERRPVLQTLEGARKLGFRLRTWRAYINELVSHLKGPVLREWDNHFRGVPKDRIEAMLRTAPTLLTVFHSWISAKGGSLDEVVEDIIGKTNTMENAEEFLQQEFGIEAEELSSQDTQEEWVRVYGAWLEGKRRSKNMPEDRFELLVRNDVNSYVALLTLRRRQKQEGPNYGQRIWYLSLDRMPWRIAKILSPGHDAVYDVAMSLSYLINCVAALANVGEVAVPEELLTATTILDETEMVSRELRDIFEAEANHGGRKYQRERRLRELAHNLKSADGQSLSALVPDSRVELLPDEDF